MVAKFKSQKVRSSATVALPTTTGARAAAAAAEGDSIFSASNFDAGFGFFAAATLMSQGEVEGGVDTPMEGGLMEKPRLRGRRGGRRRMDEIRGERWVGGGAPCCGSRQSVCWTARACARGQRVARGLWVWLIYSWKQARNFDWNPTGFCLVPAGPPGRYFSTNYSSNYIEKSPASRAIARSPGRTCFATITAAHASKTEFGGRVELTRLEVGVPYLNRGGPLRYPR